MASPKSCAILGHSPMRFAWGFDEEAAECHDMKMELAQQIMVLRQQGVTHFSVACDYGVGLYAAELINVLRDNDPELMLFCVTPYEEQATKWTPELRERYFDSLICIRAEDTNVDFLYEKDTSVPFPLCAKL